MSKKQQGAKQRDILELIRQTMSESFNAYALYDDEPYEIDPELNPIKPLAAGKEISMEEACDERFGLALMTYPILALRDHIGFPDIWLGAVDLVKDRNGISGHRLAIKPGFKDMPVGLQYPLLGMYTLVFEAGLSEAMEKGKKGTIDLMDVARLAEYPNTLYQHIEMRALQLEVMPSRDPDIFGNIYKDMNVLRANVPLREGMAEERKLQEEQSGDIKF